MGERTLAESQAEKASSRPFNQTVFRVFDEDRPYVDNIVCFRPKVNFHQATHNSKLWQTGENPDNVTRHLMPFEDWELEDTGIEPYHDHDTGQIF